MSHTSPVQWSSRFAFIMAAMGSAVGLANIWRFPYTVGVSGGGAFVFVYLGAVLLLALPLMMAELMVGRRGAAAPPVALARVAVESGASAHWGWLGIVLGGFGAVLTLSFYSIVGGWTIAYCFRAARGLLMALDTNSSEQAFASLNADPWSLMGWFLLFLSATAWVSARGVHRGVERVVQILMPALFLMLLVLLVYAAWVGDVAAALRFMFTPDFSQINAGVVMAAFGQAFFSVGVGMTLLMAYGSYIRRSISIPRSALAIVAADTLIALLAGLAIFPIIIAHAIEPAAGPGLVFLTLPVAFGQMPGGQVFGFLFFALLFVASLTSSISMMEAPVSWLHGRTRLSRSRAAVFVALCSGFLGVFAVLSFNLWSGVYPLNSIAVFEEMTFFDVYDFTVTNVLMPMGGVIIAVFVGWVMKPRFSADELWGGKAVFLFKVWRALVRYVVPMLLLAVFFDML